MSKKYRDNLDQIGTRLKQVRKSLHLTLNDMFKISGFSTSIISEVENGKKIPSSIYLYALSTELNVNINYVFTGQGEMFLAEEPRFKRDFGRDQERIEELLHYLEHYDIARYEILSSFQRFKKDNQDLIDWEKKEKKN